MTMLARVHDHSHRLGHGRTGLCSVLLTAAVTSKLAATCLLPVCQSSTASYHALTTTSISSFSPVQRTPLNWGRELSSNGDRTARRNGHRKAPLLTNFGHHTLFSLKELQVNCRHPLVLHTANVISLFNPSLQHLRMMQLNILPCLTDYTRYVTMATVTFP